MYLVNPESLISWILFPSWFSACVKDTVYLLSTRRNLAGKVRYVFFITNCRFLIFWCVGGGGLEVRDDVGCSLYLSLCWLFLSEHAMPTDQGACKDSPISAFPLTAGKTASQMHVSTAGFAEVLGLWTHVLTISWQKQSCHHWGISPASKELSKSKLRRQTIYAVPEWNKVSRMRYHQPPPRGIYSFCVFLCGNKDLPILTDFWAMDHPASHSDTAL